MALLSEKPDVVAGFTVMADSEFTGVNGENNTLIGDALIIMYGDATGGADTLTGGDGSSLNLLIGDSQFVQGRAEAGADLLIGGDGAGTNLIYGDAFYMEDSAVAGDDTIYAGDEVGYAEIYGDAFEFREYGSPQISQTVYVEAGDDTIYAGDDGGIYQIFGDAAGVYYAVNALGDDEIYGGTGNVRNILYGDAALMVSSRGGNDLLVAGDGSSGVNVLVGDADRMVNSLGGDDTLVSGDSRDNMWGDAVTIDAASAGGRDVFVFAAGNAADVIFDFQRGADLIDLSAFDLMAVDAPTTAISHLPGAALQGLSGAGIVREDFGVLDSDGDGRLGDGDDFVSLTAGGANTVIDLGAANGGAAGIDTVTLVGVIGLDESDFIFA